MPPFEVVRRLALQLFGNGIENHGYDPPQWGENVSADGQHAFNQESLRQAP